MNFTYLEALSCSKVELYAHKMVAENITVLIDISFIVLRESIEN